MRYRSASITEVDFEYHIHCPSAGSACRQMIRFRLPDFDDVECPNCGFRFSVENPRRISKFMADIIPIEEQRRKPKQQMRYDI